MEMSELWSAYWPVVLIAVAIGLVTGILIFRPKQRVTLSKDTAPIRPHMAAPTSPAASPPTVPPPVAPAPFTPRHDPPVAHDRDGGGEGNGLVDEVAAAHSDVVGQILGAPVHGNLPGSQGVPDELQKMKGVGPKLAGLLNSRGLTRFDQIAALTREEVDRLDAELGAFKGRLTRDRIVEQASYLARGDQAGYEAAFGKL
jgi:predicted flap endonuclease-1-like 5' DNA nuclease